MQELDGLDRAILALVQGDLPDGAKPFDAWAQILDIEVSDLLKRIATLKEVGIIRDFKAILRHHQIGINANAMVVWAVPEHRVEEIGRRLAQYDAITHCYERTAFGAYTIFSMIHGKAEEELLGMIRAIAEELGIRDYQVYFSIRELKKSSMQYF